MVKDDARWGKWVSFLRRVSSHAIRDLRRRNMMDAFENKKSTDGFSMKLWRGERMCLLGFDVADPEPDFVGFAIECRSPGATEFHPLLNRLAFSYDSPVADAVTGARKFPSTQAPLQKFRWVHFPRDPQPGTYTYR